MLYELEGGLWGGKGVLYELGGGWGSLGGLWDAEGGHPLPHGVVGWVGVGNTHGRPSFPRTPAEAAAVVWVGGVRGGPPAPGGGWRRC